MSFYLRLRDSELGFFLKIRVRGGGNGQFAVNPSLKSSYFDHVDAKKDILILSIFIDFVDGNMI